MISCVMVSGRQLQGAHPSSDMPSSSESSNGAREIQQRRELQHGNICMVCEGASTVMQLYWLSCHVMISRRWRKGQAIPAVGSGSPLTSMQERVAHCDRQTTATVRHSAAAGGAPVGKLLPRASLPKARLLPECICLITPGGTRR